VVYRTIPDGEFCNSTTITVNGKKETLWEVLQSDANKCCAAAGGSSGYDCSIPTAFPQLDYEDQYIAAGAVDLLDGRPPPGVPWFLQVNFAGPHPPFIVTAGKNRPWVRIAALSPTPAVPFFGRDDEQHRRAHVSFCCGQQKTSPRAAGAQYLRLLLSRLSCVDRVCYVERNSC